MRSCAPERRRWRSCRTSTDKLRLELVALANNSFGPDPAPHQLEERLDRLVAATRRSILNRNTTFKNGTGEPFRNGIGPEDTPSKSFTLMIL